jgi:hypothetical protein
MWWKWKTSAAKHTPDPDVHTSTLTPLTEKGILTKL